MTLSQSSRSSRYTPVLRLATIPSRSRRQISANNSFPAPSTCWAYSKRGQLLSRKGEPVFYAFDLLWLDGEDLRRRPLVERKSDSRDSSGPRSVQGCFTRSISSGAGRA